MYQAKLTLGTQCQESSILESFKMAKGLDVFNQGIFSLIFSVLSREIESKIQTGRPFDLF
jgi:hypothetical protein